MTSKTTAGLSNIAAIQLCTFLERQPLQGDIGTLRKTQSAIKFIQDSLGDYYTKYAELEGKVIQLASPYQQKIKDAQEDLALKAQIAQELERDESVQSAHRKLQDFKRANDLKPAEIVFKNLEYFTTAKEIFKSKYSEFQGWLSKDLILQIADFFDL